MGSEPIDFSDQSDFSLLDYMAMASYEPGAAHGAFAEFHGRFGAFLYVSCRRFRRVLGGEQGVQDLCQNTLFRAYTRAATFKGPKMLEPDQQKRSVEVWLVAIAKNLLFSDLRREPTALRPVTLDPELWQEVPEKKRDPPSQAHLDKLKAVGEVLSSLSDREQEVLRVTFQHYQMDGGAQRLPDGVAQELADRLGTTTENVRKLRERAMQKVKERLVQVLTRTAASGGRS